MRDCWSKGQCWFERLQVDSAKVFGKKPDKQKEMSIFGMIKDAFRSKVKYLRETTCVALCELGVEARMEMRRWVAEEAIGGGVSQGVIDIPEGPIRWINAKIVARAGGHGETAQSEYFQYGVPDPRIGPNTPNVRIKIAPVRSLPVVGKVVDLRWKGKDLGLRIIDRMSSDISLKQLTIDRWSLPINIKAHNDYRCWTIEPPFDSSLTAEKWSCYQAIARHLLAEWTVE
jgi:hypothetical protein